MPKRLGSVREQLLDAARRQIETGGYTKTTIRSVAAECGIAVGTVYNYFPSKDMLIASFVSEDWHACIDAIRPYDNKDAKTYLKRIYDALCAFSETHRALFTDADAAKAYYAVFSKRHRQLRAQLAYMIKPVCGDDPERENLAEFMAESLIAQTTEQKPFEDLYAILERLINKEEQKI